MPRGVPKAGFRMTKNRKAAMAGNVRSALASAIATAPKAETRETDAQIHAKLTERFEVMEAITQSAIDGNCRACIISGPAGLGKSFTVEQMLAKWDPEERNHSIVKGYVKATGLYKLLYQHRAPNQVIIFDDADSVFFDDVGLSMLKAVCDTTERRRVSYLADYNMVNEDDGEVIPRTFEFEGTIIFITNVDFDDYIERGHKIAPHLSALVSRSMYIDLAMKTRRDYIIRIRQVVSGGMLRQHGLNASQEREVMDFIEKNQEKLRELSLRMAIKIAQLRKTSNSDSWKKMARITCMRAA